jgi:hypothetical protein
MNQIPNEDRPRNLGTGLARNAANAMMTRPYRMHVEEAKALGREPLSPQDFTAQNSRGG